jgi:hypothetical protein
MKGGGQVYLSGYLLGLLGVPLTALVDAAVPVGALGQEPLGGSLELDADLDLEVIKIPN